MKLYNILLTLSLLLCLGCAEEGGDEPTQNDLPQLRISDIEIDEGIASQKATFTLELIGANPGNVSVDYRTLNGDANAGEDFEGVTSGTVSFAANESQKDIEINLIADTDIEPDEDFGVLLTNAVNAVLVRDRAIATIIDDDFNISDNGFSTPTSYDGMTLVWSDEFQADGLNLDDWTHETGDGCPNLCGWGNNELEYYQAENTYTAGDEYLIIEAKEEAVGGRDYTSSRIITKNNQNFQYGRIDIRAILPKGQGVWPALWMLGSNIDQVSWPACGEIDIMEIVGHEPAKLHGTVHWDNNGAYANFGGSTTLASGDFSDEFHVFSIIWDSQKIQWLLDDVQYHEIDITPAGLSEFRNDFFFIFNIAVGGNWPGSPNSTTVFPQRMVVDYVRVFQTN